jgi:hypothetical protein
MWDRGAWDRTESVSGRSAHMIGGMPALRCDATCEPSRRCIVLRPALLRPVHLTYARRAPLRRVPLTYAGRRIMRDRHGRSVAVLRRRTP